MLQKMKLFYDEVKEKRKGKRMRLQIDTEFQQVKIKSLNDENNIEMFTSSLRGGKAFAAEQKIRELTTRISNWTLKIENQPCKNNTKFCPEHVMKSVKYGLSPEEIER